MELQEIKALAEKVKKNVGKVIVGKDDVIDLLLIALFSAGHVLLEDVPGTGKTMLAKSLAKSLDVQCKRIQFTPDLLPSDLTGIHFFNQKTSEFEFRPGALFANILLADEINRATPRTQSSLLECMEERQVTIDGETMPLGRPFIVLATQNPVENQGTFPLPEAQLDRFLLKVKMGYPSIDEGKQILMRFKEAQPYDTLTAVAHTADIIAAQQAFSRVHVSPDLIEYMLTIVEKTRQHPDLTLGVSPRGSQSLLRAVQVYAILQGREYVTPDDVKALIKPVFAHRIIVNHTLRMKRDAAESVLDRITAEVIVPAEEKLTKEPV